MNTTVRQKVEEYMPQIVDTINKLTEIQDLCAEKGVSEKDLHLLGAQIYHWMYANQRCSRLLDESILYTGDPLPHDTFSNENL